MNPEQRSTGSDQSETDRTGEKIWALRVSGTFQLSSVQSQCEKIKHQDYPTGWSQAQRKQMDKLIDNGIEEIAEAKVALTQAFEELVRAGITIDTANQHVDELQRPLKIYRDASRIQSNLQRIANSPEGPDTPEEPVEEPEDRSREI